MTSKAEKNLAKKLKGELVDATQQVTVTPQKLERILKRAKKQDGRNK